MQGILGRIERFCPKSLEFVNQLVNFAKRKMKKEFKRQVTVYGDYFKKFKRTLSQQTIKKIYQVLVYIMTLDVIPQTYMKSISGVPGLYEIRVEDQGNIYRIFCCMDEGNLVILFNGFQKKTQKTPRKEIETATRIMKEYFSNKKKAEDHE